MSLIKNKNSRTNEEGIVAKQIIFEFERGGRVAADLLEEEAPKTCKLILSALPFENPVVHAKWAGEEIFIDGIPMPGTLDYENDTNAVVPGDVACCSSISIRHEPHLADKGVTSLCIFYGIARPRTSVDLTLDVNVFAKIKDIKAITEIARRVRWEGSEKLTIKLKSSED